MLKWPSRVWSRLLHGLLFERAKRPGIYGRHRVRPKQVWAPVYAVWGLSLVPPDRRSRLAFGSLANGRIFRTSRVVTTATMRNSPSRVSCNYLRRDDNEIVRGGGAWTLLIRSYVQSGSALLFRKNFTRVFSSKISQRLRATSLFPPIPGRRKLWPTTADTDGSTARSQVIRESKIKRHVRPTFSPVFVYAGSVSNPRSARAKQRRDAPNRISYKKRNEYSR